MQQSSDVNESLVKKQIISAIKIASKSGYAISLNEISLLLKEKLRQSEILRNIEDKKLSHELFTVENDLVVLRGYEKLFAERKSRNQVSNRLLKIARIFVNQVVQCCPNLKLVGVCGSIAYNNALKSDDIDIFIVSKNNRLWLSVFKIFILARAFSLKAFIEGKKVSICLSYAITEQQFEKEMRTRRNFLFAREFLSVHVMAGLAYFKKALEKNNWLNNIFPELYAVKLQENQLRKNSIPIITKPNVIVTALNSSIFKLLQFYLLFKAFTLNLSFKKSCRVMNMFEATITENSLVYTSEKYHEIEKMYNTFEK